jgi:hypothetical protein
VVLFSLAVWACSNGEHLVLSEAPPDSAPLPGDSITPPPSDSAPLPPDSSPLPPVDSSPPTPPDTVTPPPPDSTLPPADPPVHSGIPFGPFVYTKGSSTNSVIPASKLNPGFTAIAAPVYGPTLLRQLDAARRSNDRVLLAFAGSSRLYTDANGFNMSRWKARVDRFRSVDISSYIADGTILGHFILDEPADPSNWNGHVISLAEIEEMARYSKEIWPDLPAIIRAWPSYLKGYHYQYLDAAWAQYHSRMGSIDDFISTNVRQAKEIGLGLVGGLNVLAGGGQDGVGGYMAGKNSMSAAQIRSLGGKYLDEPYICAFLLWTYDSTYVGRPDITAAIADLSKKARSSPNTRCRNG